MAAPTTPFTRSAGNPMKLPAGFSEVTIAANTTQVFTFLTLARAVRVATAGEEVKAGASVAGMSAGAFNRVGGEWPNPGFFLGETGVFVVENETGAPVTVNLNAMHTTVEPGTPAAGALEGVTDAHLNEAD